jgi:hypothetical protein
VLTLRPRAQLEAMALTPGLTDVVKAAGFEATPII